MKRYAGPVGLLVAVTAVVLTLHYTVLEPHATPTTTVSTKAATTARRHPRRPPAAGRFAIVQRGDSFSTIAVRTHTSVADLERLNPDVSPTALRVGQKIRIH